MDVARHDADLRHAWRDDARTVRTDEPDVFVTFQYSIHHSHIVGRDSLSDTNDELDTSRRRFQNGVRGEKRRHEDHGGIGAGLGDRLFDRVEHFETLDLTAALTRRDP